MSELAPVRMSADEFLEWGLRQELRYELVDGVPVAMAGAKQRHDLIVMNAQASLHVQLRGKKCRNFSADIAVRIPAGNIRRPDAGVDCAPFDEAATTAGAPFMVMEVLSPSTRDSDMLRKLEEYKTVPGLLNILFVETEKPEALHWFRPSGQDWRFEPFETLDAEMFFPEIDCSLKLTELYEGLTFRPMPRLVRDDG